MNKHLLRTGMALGILAIPATAFADYSILNSAVSAVGGMLPDLSNYTGGSLCDAVNGSCGFAAIASTILLQFRPLLTIVGVLGLAFAGLRMMVSQEDDGIDRMRKVMSACIAGIVLAYLVEPFLAGFYGQSGSVEQGGMATGVMILSTEVQGVINWALTVTASLTILMIIYTAFVALKFTLSTTEEGVANIRKTIIYSMSGIVVLVLRLFLADAIANHPENPIALLAPTVAFIAYLISFFALAAVCVVIYAGVQLVLSWGNSEAMEKAKTILIRAVLGSAVFLLSLALVRFVIEPGVS